MFFVLSWYGLYSLFSLNFLRHSTMLLAAEPCTRTACAAQTKVIGVVLSLSLVFGLWPFVFGRGLGSWSRSLFLVFFLSCLVSLCCKALMCKFSHDTCAADLYLNI